MLYASGPYVAVAALKRLMVAVDTLRRVDLIIIVSTAIDKDQTDAPLDSAGRERNILREAAERGPILLPEVAEESIARLWK